jgi:hypothetical protein
VPSLLRLRSHAARVSTTLRASTTIASLPTLSLTSCMTLKAAMWRSETRGDRSWMEQRLARDFTEFDRSGRRYTPAEILAVEVGEIHVTLPLRDLQCRRLGGGVVLVTYESEVDGLLDLGLGGK